MEQSAIERLQAKSPEEANIEQIRRDFNLAPFMARTQFEQMREYFEQYYEMARDVGELPGFAPSLRGRVQGETVTPIATGGR
jgi:hypothetical protein